MSGRSGVIWASFMALACLLGYVAPQGESPRPGGAQAGAKESGQEAGGSVLPRPAEPFRGRIDLRAKDSKSDFPQPVQAPTGAPNILLVLLDDVGFGARQHVRRALQHADAPEAGWQRTAVQPVPYDGSVQPTRARAHHRPQPPLGAHRRASWRRGRVFPGMTR